MCGIDKQVGAWADDCCRNVILPQILIYMRLMIVKDKKKIDIFLQKELKKSLAYGIGIVDVVKWANRYSKANFLAFELLI